MKPIYTFLLVPLLAACEPPPCEDAWESADKRALHFTLSLRSGPPGCPSLITFGSEDPTNPWVECNLAGAREYESASTCTRSFSGTCTTPDGEYAASGVLYLDRDSENVTGEMTYYFRDGSTCTYGVLAQ